MKSRRQALTTADRLGIFGSVSFGAESETTAHVTKIGTACWKDTGGLDLELDLWPTNLRSPLGSGLGSGPGCCHERPFRTRTGSNGCHLEPL